MTSMIMSSCSFINFISDTLTSLVIKEHNLSYMVGDTYYDNCALEITGQYNNGYTKKLSLSDVNISLSLDNVSYKAKDAFTETGEYLLSVTKGYVRSNYVAIRVFNEPQYVSSMSVEGSNEGYVGSKTFLTISVTPMYFTVPIEASSSDTSIATVEKVNSTEFRVTGVAEGAVNINFRAHSGEETYCLASHEMTITHKTFVEMNYNYQTIRDHLNHPLSSFPLSGNPKVLIIPVWFTDSGTFIRNSTYKNNVKNDIQKAYLGTTEETGWHSVKTFYQEESSGRLNLEGKVTDWWPCGISSSAAAALEDSSELVKQAAKWYFDNNSLDSRTNYDYNSDGYIDAMLLIYGAPDMDTYKQYASLGENLWAYCYWVQDTSLKNLSNPGVNTYFWASYDFIYGNNTALSRTGESYNHGDTSHCTIDAHTYIHEMGHVLGLDDYYDYYRPDDRHTNTNPAGGFSMQDSNVGGHDGFSLTALGWSNAYIPTESCNITLSDLSSSKEVIILSNNWNSYNSPFDEYLLLELYSPSGLNELDSTYQYRGNYPQGPSVVGIRLWHVDARLSRGSSGRGSFVSNPELSSINVALNNTSADSSQEDKGGRTCEIGSSYQQYNLLQLIRNNTNATYSSKDDIRNSDLFIKNSVFTKETFSKQFRNGTQFDNGEQISWSFAVTNIVDEYGNYQATVRLVKN